MQKQKERRNFAQNQDFGLSEQTEDVIRKIQESYGPTTIVFPKRSQLNDILKIQCTNFKEAKKIILDRIRQISKENYKNIKWQFEWSEQDFQSKKLTIVCKSLLYECGAKLIYQLKDGENCFYLRKCFNEHKHIPSKYELLKQIGVSPNRKKVIFQNLEENKVLAAKLNEILKQRQSYLLQIRKEKADEEQTKRKKSTPRFKQIRSFFDQNQRS